MIKQPSQVMKQPSSSHSPNKQHRTALQVKRQDLSLKVKRVMETNRQKMIEDKIESSLMQSGGVMTSAEEQALFPNINAQVIDPSLIQMQNPFAMRQSVQLSDEAENASLLSKYQYFLRHQNNLANMSKQIQNR